MNCIAQLEAVPGGDGIYQISLGDLSPFTTSYQSTGLMLYQDDSNFLRFELAGNNGDGVYANAFSVIHNAQGPDILGPSVTLGVVNAIQVAKTGSQYAYQFSSDGGVTWQTAGSISATLDVTKAGPYVLNSESNALTYGSFSAFTYPTTTSPSPTPTPVPSRGSCGDEPPPQQAADAGFTTCAANFDWTAPTGASWLPSKYAFSGAVSDTSNWLDCTPPGGNTALPWHYSYLVYGAKGCNAFITPDPTYGGNVLNLQWLASWGHGTSENITTNANGYSGPATPGLPNGMYWEITYRVGTLTGECCGGDLDAFTGTNPPAIAFNTELYTGDKTAGDASSGTGYVPTNPGGFYWSGDAYNEDCRAPMATPCHTLIPSGWTNTAYHTYGWLQTLNNPGGSTIPRMYACAYIDNVLQGCDSGNNLPSTSAYNALTYIILQNDIYSSTPYAQNVDMYVKSIRVWACPGWATTECPGTTLVNGPPPKLTFYH